MHTLFDVVVLIALTHFNHKVIKISDKFETSLLFTGIFYAVGTLISELL